MKYLRATEKGFSHLFQLIFIDKKIYAAILNFPETTLSFLNALNFSFPLYDIELMLTSCCFILKNK